MEKLKKKKKIVVAVIFRDKTAENTFYEISKIYNDPRLSDEEKLERCMDKKVEMPTSTKQTGLDQEICRKE